MLSDAVYYFRGGRLFPRWWMLPRGGRGQGQLRSESRGSYRDCHEVDIELLPVRLRWEFGSGLL